MYGVNEDKVKLFEKKIVTLEDIIAKDELIIKELNENVSLLEVDLMTAKTIEVGALQEASEARGEAFEWRRRTLLGIPISIAGGFLIATLIQH